MNVFDIDCTKCGAQAGYPCLSPETNQPVREACLQRVADAKLIDRLRRKAKESSRGE